MKHHRPYRLLTPSPAAPPPLPAGIDPAAVHERRTAMIEAGTHPILAARLALSAGENQAMRERSLRSAAAAESGMVDQPF